MQSHVNGNEHDIFHQTTGRIL